jgi:transposase
MDQQRFIFIDETGCNLDLSRGYARAPKGQRAIDKSVPRNTPASLSLIGALNLEGVLCSMQIEGAVDGAAFEVFVTECLCPRLQEGDFVLLDNLSAHGSARIQELIEARGAWLIYLPRYSPQLNPIEGAWSKLKAYLRQVAARCRLDLDEAISQGLARISASDAEGWFFAAGYSI